MQENKKLSKYDVKHNNFSDEGIEKICEIMLTATHVFEFEISELVSEAVVEKLKFCLASNKPKKGKKGKKGKK
jgi:hypothetical protein